RYYRVLYYIVIPEAQKQVVTVRPIHRFALLVAISGAAVLRIFTVGFGLLIGIVGASAQDWPQRPVKLVVPYPAGGGTDIVARVLAQKLGDTLGQRFIVENKSGASGMVGAQSVAKGEADGYTFLVASPAEIALNQYLFKEMTYDPLKDLT